MQIFTIGYEGKSSHEFFELIKSNSIDCLVDIRIYPNSDDAGFASQRDLPYLLKEVANCEYRYMKNLAPTEFILNDYHREPDYETYIKRFTKLMDERDIPTSLDRAFFKNNTCCLLCFEASYLNCHRTLIAKRMQTIWEDLEIINL